MICLLINSHHNIILVSASFVLNQFYLVPKHLLDFRKRLRKTILAALRIDVLHSVILGSESRVRSVPSVVCCGVVTLPLVYLWREFVTLVLIKAYQVLLLLQNASV